MTVALREESIGRLAEHAGIPGSFTAESVLDVPENGPLRIPLGVRPVPAPYIKDYDALPGNRPDEWGARFDLSSWRLIAAYDGDRRVGGAVVALAVTGIDPSAGRGDAAVLWDIRVAPAARRTGIGSRLLRAAEELAARNSCRQLLVETQDINVPACRLYARHGYELESVDRHAYPDLPNETRLVWSRSLSTHLT